MSAAAPMLHKEGPNSGPKHRGCGDLSIVVPEEKLASYGFRAQTAAAEITYPPWRDTPTGSFWVVSLHF